MNRRSELIREVAQYGPRYACCKTELQKYPWDYEKELYLLTRKDVLGVFNRFCDGDLDAEELSHWASFLECRDDVGYEEIASNVLSEVIFLLANPDINYKVDATLVDKLRKHVWENKT